MLHVKVNNGIVEIYKKQEGKKKVIAKGNIQNISLGGAPVPPVYVGKVNMCAPVGIEVGQYTGSNRCSASRYQVNVVGHTNANIYQVSENWWNQQQAGTGMTRREKILHDLTNLTSVSIRIDKLKLDLQMHHWYDESSFNAFADKIRQAEQSVITWFTPKIGTGVSWQDHHADDRYCYVYQRGSKFFYELKEA